MMPYKMRKIINKPCYKVYNTKTKRIFSKCSSFYNAKRQIKLLSAIRYNKSFVKTPRLNSQSLDRKNEKKNKNITYKIKKQ
jgi:hypothetical protein